MMTKGDTLKHFWAGIFFLAGIGIVVGVIFFIGLQRGFTEPKFGLTVLFDKVGGLSEGSPVRLSGVTVGRVEEISFLDREVKGRGIKVRLSLYRKFESQIQRCTGVSVLTEGVLGAKYIEMARDPGLPGIDIMQPVLGEPMLDVYDLAEILEDTADSFNATTRGINVMMYELNDISRKTKRLLDRIERRVIEGNLFKIF